MTQAGLDFRSSALAERGGAMLSLVLIVGTLSAIWFVFLTNIVSLGEAKVAERSNFASVRSADESLGVAGSAIEAIAADLSKATWTDLPDGALGLSAMTLSLDDEIRELPLGETFRYEVALGALERTSGASTNIVMSGVRSVSFSRSGKIVTTSLEIVSKSGTSQTVEFAALLSAF